MEVPKQRPTDADTARELAAVKAESLLPAEKWLIAGSLMLGLGLLGVLLWYCRTRYPVGG